MPTIATRLTYLVIHLRQAIAAHLDRQTRAQNLVWLGTQSYSPKVAPERLPPLAAPLWSLLLRRLDRLSVRFNTLFQRWRDNCLPRRRPARARTRPTTGPGPQPLPRLPTAHGWVNHRIPESAPPTGQLESLLRDPETRALVAAAPQAGRLLRPLCRALGIPQPDWLRLPKRPRTPPTRKTRPTPPPPAGLQVAPPRPTPQVTSTPLHTVRQKTSSA